MWGKKARGKKNTLLKRSVFLEIVHHTIYSFSTDTPSFSRPQLHLLQFEKMILSGSLFDQKRCSHGTACRCGGFLERHQTFINPKSNYYYYHH